MNKKTQLIVIAHRIRSLYNVGSIFRTCDALGVEKLYLTGYTATPEQKPIQLHKTALGAEQIVSWEHSRNIGTVLAKLKQHGYQIIGIEEKKGISQDFRTWKPTKKTAIILGNEIYGIHARTLKKCDQIIHLPMRGSKKSLNVAVAFGAIGYYMAAQTGSRTAHA